MKGPNHVTNGLLINLSDGFDRSTVSV